MRSVIVPDDLAIGSGVCADVPVNGTGKDRARNGGDRRGLRGAAGTAIAAARRRRHPHALAITNFIQVWRQHNIEAESAAVERQRDFSRTHIIIGAVVPAILLWSLWREGLSQFLKTYQK